MEVEKQGHFKINLVPKMVIFHFHDCWRKSTQYYQLAPENRPSQKCYVSFREGNHPQKISSQIVQKCPEFALSPTRYVCVQGARKTLRSVKVEGHAWGSYKGEISPH